mmetsp:Transcript_26027/g.48851  ORF Transcript_26027/g.48851 Transcript_26027/m.48851 type:complete len:83 (-) Transcript_26027:65-313(-)
MWLPWTASTLFSQAGDILCTSASLARALCLQQLHLKAGSTWLRERAVAANSICSSAVMVLVGNHYRNFQYHVWDVALRPLGA